MMKIIPINCCENFTPEPAAAETADVRVILAEVALRGDEAVKEYCQRFDGVIPPRCEIPASEFAAAAAMIPPELRKELENAAARIRRFAQAQMEQLHDFRLEIEPGVFAGQRVIPLEKVGVYVPGGNFPLVSSLLMGVVPAKTAGVEQVIVCTPPRRDGSANPVLLAAAYIAGADRFFLIGGVQAIGALAYGTDSVPAVDKIVGPGNKYVAAAKKEVYGKVGIDFIAGPSEVAIIADDSANPLFIAADLLAQAEHDADAIPILITSSRSLAETVADTVEIRLNDPLLSTRDIARRSVERNGKIYLVRDMAEACKLADKLAPEHLELMVDDAPVWAGCCRNFGSLFIGAYAAEVLGDYSSGLNHTLPTSGAARYTGGLSVRDFLKIATTLEADFSGFNRIASGARILAEFEGLSAHAAAVAIRQSAASSPPSSTI